MVKTRIGGNKDGLGFYELLKMGLSRSQAVPFYLTMFMIKCHMNSLTRKLLGIK